MRSSVSNFDRPSIIDVNVAIAKAARVLNVQTVLTTVEKKGFSGYRSAMGLCGHAPPPRS